jgi:chromosome segregation ATPase
MVETDISQLSSECRSWREHLRSYRDQFGQLKNQLETLARDQRQSDILKDVEHFHNQFHIQLINIHDLKHSIKNHERTVELGSAAGNLRETDYALHEQLHEEYVSLGHTLETLKNDFTTFSERVH